jgi:hypothetical protein
MTGRPVNLDHYSPIVRSVSLKNFGSFTLPGNPPQTTMRRFKEADKRDFSLS